MFFMSFISHLLSAWFAFLLPCFATFKALNHLPHSEPELKRWAMYWSIVGVFVAFEYVAEWVISWFPFYWEVKTLFLLYLSLPQTQGSTYIYQTYVHPFLIKNEASIDSGIAALQSNALAFIQAKLGDLFGYITKAAGQNPTTATPGGAPGAPPNAAQWQSAAFGLWNTYGASIMNAVRPAAAGTPNTAAYATTPVGAQRSNPNTPNKPRSSSSTPNEYFAASTAVPGPNPPFPTPQHFQGR
ncbi:hypothetical protein FA13DRAFT_1724933 [Coprinellus micaceus]|uniref:Protein YOP1 n=1 Tax=Coprinellus micaceus TaxID=71717 RepID=A0A4Y7TYS2_COPMI|nr:hypothetical protein FA13DRAFT_1724933 [Coprinellus micaceus]